MGYFANYTNNKLIISKKPITINGQVYDPSIVKENIKGFKWFKTKSEIYKFYNINNNETELYKFELTNNSTVYCVGYDEDDCRDKVLNYITNRFFGGSVVNIDKSELIAEINTKGFVDKLVI